jgi:hypothetical protein
VGFLFDVCCSRVAVLRRRAIVKPRAQPNEVRVARKFYKPGTGFILEIDQTSGDRLELIKIE